MKRLILTLIIITGCSSYISHESDSENQDAIFVDLIKTWLDQNNYPIDSSTYTARIVFSNGLDPSGFVDTNLLPNSVLRDSMRIEGDSVKINQLLNVKTKETDRLKVQFYFSNFLFNTSETTAISHLSILFLNSVQDRITGGEERIVIFGKDKADWIVIEEVTYIEY